MRREHVGPHLPSRNLLQYHLLFVVHPVPNEMVIRQNLLGASMVDWVIDEVQSWLNVQVYSNRGRDSIHALHLELELSREARLLPSHGQRHVLALAQKIVAATRLLMSSLLTYV